MISVIIPTQGRATLERTLESISAYQSNHWRETPTLDEVIVVIDAFEMTDDDIASIKRRVECWGKMFRAVAFDAGHHCFGHCQLNHGIDLALDANYLVFNDDDDVFEPGGLAAVARVGTEEREFHCHIFKFITPWGQVLPAGTNLFEGGVGGHCLVVPKVPERVGRFTCRYAGDWDMIADTVSKWPGNVMFHDDIIARTRPNG